MKKSFLNSKIHKATVTDSQIDYEGSCEIDIALLNAAGISVYEKIDIYKPFFNKNAKNTQNIKKANLIAKTHKTNIN